MEPTVGSMACKHAPLLPFEIIVHILESHVHTNYSFNRDDTFIPLESYSRTIQDSKFVRNCALVSTHWNAASRDVLSRLRTIVGKCNNAQSYLNLLDVPQSPASYPIRHLVLYNGERFTKERERLGLLSAALLYKCHTTLRFLEVDSGGMAMRRVFSPPTLFSNTIPKPIFTFLRYLSVRFHPFPDVAVLLQHCPNLEIFHLAGSTPLSDKPNCSLSAALLHSPPPFSLRELRVFDSNLTLEQCRWLLASSHHTLSTLHLFHVWALSPLASVFALTCAVKHLYLRPLRTSRTSQGVEDNYLSVLAAFRGLKSLRIDGLEGFWTAVFEAIADTGELENLEVELRLEIIAPLMQFLSSPAWQRNLHTLVIRHRRWMNSSWGLTLEIVEGARKLLGEACTARNVALKWITLDQSSVLFPGYHSDS